MTINQWAEREERNRDSAGQFAPVTKCASYCYSSSPLSEMLGHSLTGCFVLRVGTAVSAYMTAAECCSAYDNHSVPVSRFCAAHQYRSM